MSSAAKLALLTVLLGTLPTAWASEEPEAFKGRLFEKRLEQVTAPGRVPAGIPVKHATVAVPQEQPHITEAQLHLQDHSLAAGDLQAFRHAYQRAGAPRIAIYFNRELSDEIREWHAASRNVTSVHNSQSISGHSQAAGEFSTQSHGDLTLIQGTEYYLGNEGERSSPRESWMWRFEDAITGLFLEAGATVVDRSLILRQMARIDSEQPSSTTRSGTLNEIAALDRFADILVEVRVTRSGSILGYDFRGTAKQIGTGQLLASAFVDGAPDPRNPAQYQFVTISKGYERQEITPALTLEGISRELTLKLMRSWSYQP